MQDSFHFSGIKGSDPAGTQSLSSGSQNEMVHSNGNVDIQIALSVASSPGLAYDATSTYHYRRSPEPWPGIGCLQFFLHLSLPYHYETPGLCIGCGRGDPRCLKNPLQFILFHISILVFSYATAFSDHFIVIHSFSPPLSFLSDYTICSQRSNRACKVGSLYTKVARPD